MRKVVLVAVCAAALAGCAGGPQGVEKNPNAAGDATNLPSLHYTAARTVAIGDAGFIPSAVRVGVDTTIHWVNRSTHAQSIRWTGGPGANFTSGRLEPGQHFCILMPLVGTVSYRSGHGGLHGTIEVGAV